MLISAIFSAFFFLACLIYKFRHKDHSMETEDDFDHYQGTKMSDLPTKSKEAEAMGTVLVEEYDNEAASSKL